jgi:hypothetical protein
VSATADHAEYAGELGAIVAKLGIRAGQVVQEIGVDDDCDEPLRSAIAAVSGHALVDDSYDDTVDVVVLWWRRDDGDLVDALVDAPTALVDSGVVWLLTPKAGRDGHVEPSDIGEAAPLAGLAATSSVSAASDWSGTKLATPRQSRR